MGSKGPESSDFGDGRKESRVSEAGLGTALLGLQWEHLPQPQTTQIAPKAGPGHWARGLLAVLELEAACLPAWESPAASAPPGLVPTETEPSMKAAGGLGCISPGCLYLGATGITPGPTATGLCLHPAQVTGRGQGTAPLWAEDPSLGWPTQDPQGSFAEAGYPGLPPWAGAGRMLAPLAQCLARSEQ